MVTGIQKESLKVLLVKLSVQYNKKSQKRVHAVEQLILSESCPLVIVSLPY